MKSISLFMVSLSTLLLHVGPAAAACGPDARLAEVWLSSADGWITTRNDSHSAKLKSLGFTGPILVASDSYGNELALLGSEKVSGNFQRRSVVSVGGEIVAEVESRSPAENVTYGDIRLCGEDSGNMSVSSITENRGDLFRARNSAQIKVTFPAQNKIYTFTFNTNDFSSWESLKATYFWNGATAEFAVLDQTGKRVALIAFELHQIKMPRDPYVTAARLKSLDPSFDGRLGLLILRQALQHFAYAPSPSRLD